MIGTFSFDGNYLAVFSFFLFFLISVLCLFLNGENDVNGGL